jgi:Kdo2-lipid IVA lauroyltransferase/acyltransferase
MPCWSARPVLKRRLQYLVEGAGAVLLYAAFRLLPLDAASALGGWLARSIGPHLAISRRALRNLRRALPEIGEAEGKRIVAGMWDNLGRVIAEYPHLAKYRAYERGGRIEIVGAEHIRDQAVPGRRAIFFSGHFGNWEVATLAVTQAGLEVVEMYRAANNPIVDQLITHSRSVVGSELAAKGSAGARRMLAAMKSGRHIALLVDQKKNDGIAVPFFGRDAMTEQSLAVFALRFDCAVVPVRVDRLERAHFRITAEAPLAWRRSGNDAADALALMIQVNQVLERWIRERPDQWFWLHRRWPE